MDEANRCQELIYLSNGRVLAQGSQQQILHSANIFIWNIYSQQIDYAYKILKKFHLFKIFRYLIKHYKSAQSILKQVI